MAFLICLGSSLFDLDCDYAFVLVEQEEVTLTDFECLDQLTGHSYSVMSCELNASKQPHHASPSNDWNIGYLRVSIPQLLSYQNIPKYLCTRNTLFDRARSKWDRQEPYMTKETIEIRGKLYGQLEKIAVEEDMTMEELVDHVLRAYSEAWPFDEDDEEDEGN